MRAHACGDGRCIAALLPIAKVATELDSIGYVPVSVSVFQHKTPRLAKICSQSPQQ